MFLCRPARLKIPVNGSIYTARPTMVIPPVLQRVNAGFVPLPFPWLPRALFD